MSTPEDEIKTPAPPPVAEAKMEDAETANPVVATEALAAAAAAAVNAAEVPQEPIVLASPTPAQGRVSLLSDVDGQGKRRFFPRVKHLIGNKEWEDVSTVPFFLNFTANSIHTHSLLFLSIAHYTVPHTSPSVHRRGGRPRDRRRLPQGQQRLVQGL